MGTHIFNSFIIGSCRWNCWKKLLPSKCKLIFLESCPVNGKFLIEIERKLGELIHPKRSLKSHLQKNQETRTGVEAREGKGTNV
jgi:hypothetical protein